MILLTASASSAGTGALTSFTLILIAVLIVVVIAAILWGARQKSIRAAGEEQEAARAEAMLAHPQTDSAVVSTPVAVAKPKPAVAKAPVAKPAPQPRAAAKAPAAKTAAPAKAKAATPVAKAAPAAKPAAKPVAKIVAAPKPQPAKPAAAKAPAKPKPAAAPVSRYGLIDVKGLGPKAVPLLAAQGVGDLTALAGLSAARAAEIDAGLGALAGRMARDQWIAQAKLLAAGKVAEFEGKYGKL